MEYIVIWLTIQVTQGEMHRKRLVSLASLKCSAAFTGTVSSSPLALVLVFTRVADAAIFAIIFRVHEQGGTHPRSPLVHLAFGLALSQRVHVLQIRCRVTLQRVRNEAVVPFFILLEAHRHYA